MAVRDDLSRQVREDKMQMFETLKTEIDDLEIDMTEAARIARVSVDRMRSLTFRYPTELPTRRYGGAKKYVRRADLMRFLKARQVS